MWADRPEYPICCSRGSTGAARRIENIACKLSLRPPVGLSGKGSAEWAASRSGGCGGERDDGGGAESEVGGEVEVCLGCYEALDDGREYEITGSAV